MRFAAAIISEANILISAIVRDRAVCLPPICRRVEVHVITRHLYLPLSNPPHHLTLPRAGCTEGYSLDWNRAGRVFLAMPKRGKRKVEADRSKSGGAIDVG